MTTKLDSVSIADLLAFAKKLQPRETAPATPPTHSPRTRYPTEQEKTAIVEMHRSGCSKNQIVKTFRRGNRTIQAILDADNKKNDALANAIFTQKREFKSDETIGLGSIKRSMERLHDKTTALENKITSQSTRLNDVTAMVARVQQTVDKIVREFVNTNPPPAELIHPTVRTNGHIKE